MNLRIWRQAPQSYKTSEVLLTPGQMVAGLLLVLLFAAEWYWLGTVALLRTVIGLVIAFYVVFVAMKLALWAIANRHQWPTGYRLPSLDDPALPSYTVLVPLRGEASVVERLVKALSRLQYPAGKLQILLLLEEYDIETQEAVLSVRLPGHIQSLVVPDVGPRTKPKACNFGYMEATGSMLVIFDAEDRPEPLQLLKAVAAFRLAGKEDPRIACLQGILSFWNPRNSWVGAFCYAEYVVHFRWVLTGLASLGLISPLGGTSNHFYKQALDDVARLNGSRKFVNASGQEVLLYGPWDSFNVTEDADLAMRLAKCGYRTGMLNSVTYEEPPNKAGRARNQRSRWLQGYAQTGLVHLRRPFRAMGDVGVWPFLAFELLMLGTPLALLLNPLTWATTGLYIASRLAPWPDVQVYMEGLFPLAVYYAGMMVALFGNALLFYQKLSAVAREQELAEARSGGAEHELGNHMAEQQYGLIPRLLLMPFWWAFTSMAAYQGVCKLLIPSLRSKWNKTDHGHDLDLEAALELPQAGTTTPPLPGLAPQRLEER